MTSNFWRGINRMAKLTVIGIVLATFLSFVFPYPFHASCKIDWTFGRPCSDVSGAIVKQIHAWEGPSGCDGGGERCLYKLVSETSTEVKATHTTPKAGYVDDLTFTFKQAGQDACDVHGESSSETWYAVLDKGTNYCNLHNLIQGAGLDKVTGYKETTSNSVCTQYSSADCDVY